MVGTAVPVARALSTRLSVSPALEPQNNVAQRAAADVADDDEIRTIETSPFGEARSGTEQHYPADDAEPVKESKKPSQEHTLRGRWRIMARVGPAVTTSVAAATRAVSRGADINEARIVSGEPRPSRVSLTSLSELCSICEYLDETGLFAQRCVHSIRRSETRSRLWR